MTMILDPITELVATMAARRRMRLAFIRGRSRDAAVVRVRIEIAKKLRSKKIKLEEIAYHLNRHHSTVVYYLSQRPMRLARYATRQEARHEVAGANAPAHRHSLSDGRQRQASDAARERSSACDQAQ